MSKSLIIDKRTFTSVFYPESWMSRDFGY